jgi:hypothetical protein
MATHAQPDIKDLTKHWHGQVYDLTKIVEARDTHPQAIVNQVTRDVQACAGDRLVSVGQRNIGEYNWNRSAPSFDLQGIALMVSFDNAAAARAAAVVMGDRVQVQMRDARPSSEAPPIKIPYDQFVGA